MKHVHGVPISSGDDDDPFPLRQADVVAGLVGKCSEQAVRTPVGFEGNSHHPDRLQDTENALLFLAPKPHAFQRDVGLSPVLDDGRVRLDQKGALGPGQLAKGRAACFRGVGIAIVQDRSPREVEETEARSGKAQPEAKSRGANLAGIFQAEEEGLPTGVPANTGPGS
jgi:hypothetical protein